MITVVSLGITKRALKNNFKILKNDIISFTKYFTSIYTIRVNENVDPYIIKLKIFYSKISGFYSV